MLGQETGNPNLRASRGQSLQGEGGLAPSCSLPSEWRWRRRHGAFRSWMCTAHSVLSAPSGPGGARRWVRQPRPQHRKDETVTITRRLSHCIAGPVLRVQRKAAHPWVPCRGGVKWVWRMVEGAPGP